MNQILLTLGALTLGGSAAVLLLAFMGKKSRYGARWRCWAWLVLCLRLAVPVPLLSLFQERAPIQVDLPNPPAAVQTNPASSGTENPPPANPTSPTTAPSGPNTNPSGGNPNAAPPAPAQPSQPEENPTLRRTVPLALLGIWLVEAAVLLLWSGWSHWRFLSYLKRWSSPVTDGEIIQAFNYLGDQLGLPKRPRLLMCQGLKVPMLAGLLRPALLLPQGSMTGDALGLSLLHELTHYRRRDIWLKTLAMWVNTVHWFNPLMWYMVRLVERDTELACDEDALRRLSPADYRAYGQTILSAVAKLQSKGD